MHTAAPHRPDLTPVDIDADLDLLTGVEAGHLLDAAASAAGARVGRWRAGEVTPRRRGVGVRYHAEVVWPDGRTTTETLGACTGDLPEGALVLDGGDVRVAVWMLPHDPRLPGLAAALDEARVAGLLDDLGLGKGPVRLALRAYRPGRRAVVEATTPSGRLFLKVVRPDRVEDLHRRHRTLIDAGVPVPPSAGFSTDGLVVLGALPGSTLRDALGTGRRLPSGEAVDELLDRLPTSAADPTPRPSWLDRVGHYAAITARVVPECSARLGAVVDSVRDRGATGPVVPVHGDLYDSQLIVEGGRITGLLDVDTLRLGDRIDDQACLLGHLSALAHHDPSRARAIRAAGAAFLSSFERRVDPEALRLRTAAVVVSLSTGPHRTQQANWERSTRALVDLAARWVASASNR
jgi:hypothetical protein